MSALTLCKETLKLHSAQANYVAKIWKMSLQSNTDAPYFSVYCCDSEGTIEWVNSPFPNNMDDIFWILYLMRMITNLVLNVRKVMMIVRLTYTQ